MRRVAVLLTGLAILALLVGLTPAGAESKPAKAVKSFSLKDADGKAWSLAGQKDKKAVVVLFLGTECPINNQYLPRLAELHKEYAGRGVAFVGVNSNAHDTATRVAGHAKANAVPFPVLKDVGNAVADDFGARRTPEAFVVSPAGKVLYQGRIDDQIGVGFKRKEPTRRDLAVALDEALAGKPVSTPLTDAPGCLIARAIQPKETGTVTFARHVSRILQNRCQECHRPGEVGPMPLLSYEDALSWQGMIEEVVSEGRMPPWHADPKHGKFANDRSLTKEEKETLLSWITQGCPKGDDKDLPPAKEFAKGWMIGKPDVVFEMPRPFTVPADGGPGASATSTFGCRPKRPPRTGGSRRRGPAGGGVVHHIIVYVVEESGAGRRTARGAGRGHPRRHRQRLPGGVRPGRHASEPAGRLRQEAAQGGAGGLPDALHDGVERKDRSSVGLVFAKGPPKYEVRTRGIAQQFFRIPPGSKAHEVKSKTTYDRDVTLMSLLPHMHLRGKDFKYEATFPDGRKETLLSVPRLTSTGRATTGWNNPSGCPPARGSTARRTSTTRRTTRTTPTRRRGSFGASRPGKR
ncbi:MAG: redoxin domain-containing protein [Gemmataceae bacterium]